MFRIVPIVLVTAGVLGLAGPANARPVPDEGISFPTSAELAGRNLVVCADGADTGFFFDGPSFRAETVADRHCRAYTVAAGQYTIGYQDPAHGSFDHLLLSRAPGQTAWIYDDQVLTNVAGVPASPSLGSLDQEGRATGPGINVTLVVFHFC